MRTVARLSDNDRRELFRNTAGKMGLHDAIVEKDFWVCCMPDYPASSLYRSLAFLTCFSKFSSG